MLRPYKLLIAIVISILPRMFTVASPEAATITLTASQDATLYVEPNGTLSNGAGSHLFAGRNGDNRVQRGLIRFDIVAAIPKGARIQSVDVALFVSTPDSHAATVGLHRMFAPWGEGTSNALRGEGGGAPASPGDATWLHSHFDTALWATPGGVFAADASASLAMAGNGQQIWTSTPELVADVQSWLDAPRTNFGWLLLNIDEVNIPGVRFNSREWFKIPEQPQLRLEFTPPPLQIFPRSGPFVATQAFDMVLVLGPLPSPIAGLVALLNGIDFSDEFGPCFELERGTLASGGQTLRCANQSGATLGVGSQDLQITIILENGIEISDAVVWEIQDNSEP